METNKEDIARPHIVTLIDNEMIRICKDPHLQHPVIVALFEGRTLPKYCVPMPRDPEPRVNIPLSSNFSEVYFSALRENPSIKDGAILIQIDHSPPILKGFSYRIYPPPLNTARAEKNMGSGYNSSLDFSGINKVKCVYFVNKGSVRKFTKGKEERLC